MLNKAEAELFLIWNTARIYENSILEEIKKQFKILEIYEIEWSEKNFKLNLERFYCERIRSKIKHTGTGKFLLVTVLDENPDYGYEKTLKGFEFVNRKTLSVKQKIRKITGRYNIHSTNDRIEADKNLTGAWVKI